VIPLEPAPFCKLLLTVDTSKRWALSINIAINKRGHLIKVI
jgi:hypothetical protein